MRVKLTSMIQRCHNPNNTAFARYGGKGISVCSRWRESVDAFIADMGPCPPDMSIDRIDTTRGYEPGNCRWATPVEQQNNRRDNFYVTYQGERMTLVQLGERVGINSYTLRGRIVAGMSPEEAVATPIAPRRTPRLLTDEEKNEIRRRVVIGETHRAIAVAFGCDKSYISRIVNGRPYRGKHPRAA